MSAAPALKDLIPRFEPFPWRDPALPLALQKDATRANEILNHPEVYSWCKGRYEGRLDIGKVMALPGNLVLLGEHGGAWFSKMQGGLYEAHVMVLPEGRGAWAARMCEAMKRWMFFRTDALEIVARVPHRNLAARAMARMVGGVFEFTHDEELPLHGELVPVDIYRLLIWDWLKVAPHLEARGQWFHDLLKFKYLASGRPDPSHEDDATHNRYVGAAAEMMLGGQVYKAQAFYNRWAALVRGPRLEIVSKEPLVLGILKERIRVRGSSFEVI